MTYSGEIVRVLSGMFGITITFTLAGLAFIAWAKRAATDD